MGRKDDGGVDRRDDGGVGRKDDGGVGRRDDDDDVGELVVIFPTESPVKIKK